MNRDCKVAPIRKYLARVADGSRMVRKNIVQYIGIAKDEPSRLGRIDGVKKISLLDKYGYTEAMSRQKAEEYGLLSPIYATGTRNGCWFCPNCSIKQFSQLRKLHPELWGELVQLSHTPNLCSYGFKYGKTVQDVEKLIDWNDRQLKLFNND
jgi:hypothetical protein